MAPARKKNVKSKAPIRRASSLRRKHSIRPQHPIARPPPRRPSLIVTLKLPVAHRAQAFLRQPSLPAAQAVTSQLSNHREQDTSTVASLSPPSSPRIAAGIIRQLRGLDEPKRTLGLHFRSRDRVKHEFSSAQLVYSGIISRAKPHGMNMEVFIRTVENRRRKRLPKPVDPDEQLCFDSVSWLKQVAHDTYQDNVRLRAENARLERLLRKSKRKADEENVEQMATQLLDEGDYGNSQLQSQRQCEESAQNPEAVCEIQPTHNLPALCYLLIKTAHTLNVHIKTGNVASQTLAASILATIHAIYEALESNLLKSPSHLARSHSCSSPNDLNQIFKVASAVYGLCLRGLSHLCRDIAGRGKYKGQVICQLIELFKSCLTWNQDLCYVVANGEYERWEESLEELPVSVQCSPNAPKLEEVMIPELLSLRTEFMADIFLSKELTTTGRPQYFTELLGGLCVALFKKTGKLVSLTVFKEDVAASSLPGHISMLRPDAKRDPVQELAVAIEREQVDRLLQRVVRRIEGIEMEGGLKTSSLPRLLSQPFILHGNVDTRMFVHAKERLQATLCKAIFGEDKEEFVYALKECMWNDEDDDGAQEEKRVVKVNDDGEKFVGDVWELVGWDILRGI